MTTGAGGSSPIVCVPITVTPACQAEIAYAISAKIGCIKKGATPSSKVFDVHSKFSIFFRLTSSIRYPALVAAFVMGHKHKLMSRFIAINGRFSRRCRSG